MKGNNKKEITHLFEPKSVAVFGASLNAKKIGYKVLDNIVSSGYPHRLYPINTRGGTLLGKQVYKRLEDVEDSIDVALIVIPAPLVFDSVKSCVQMGVKFALIITSGFSEIGKIEEERKIAKYAKDHGLRLLGPNIFGIYSSAGPINATFGTKDMPSGDVAIITQSGALGATLIG